MKMLFAGGGTLGPVTPLLAIAEEFVRADRGFQGVWIGTPNGPERALVEPAGFRFLHLPVARLTRYPSVEWFFLPLRFLQALLTAWSVVGREKPDVVATAGGYTGVPLAWVAAAKGIPVWVHQPDVMPILSVRLVAPVAKLITVAWPQTARAFSKNRTKVVGNPVRPALHAGARDRAFERFGFDLTRPTVLVAGGGGGSAWLNEMTGEALPVLLETMNILHLTGPGKTSPHPPVPRRYAAVEQLTDGMADALALADVVVTRAGMGAIAECAALSKPAIVIPLPHSPQGANAKVLATAGAAIVLDQSVTSLGDFTATIRDLVHDTARREQLGRSLHALLPTETRVIAEEIRMLRRQKQNRPG